MTGRVSYILVKVPHAFFPKTHRATRFEMDAYETLTIFSATGTLVAVYARDQWKSAKRVTR